MTKSKPPRREKPVKAWALVDSLGNVGTFGIYHCVYHDEKTAHEVSPYMSREEGDTIYIVKPVLITVVKP